jgi:TIR domain-containing protein/pentapeptide repeat protein
MKSSKRQSITKPTQSRRMSLSSVLAAYRSGQRLFHYVDISGANLSDKDLTGASFYGGDLRGVNFSGSRMTHVQLKGADVSGAKLTYASLNATDLIGVNFSGCDFSHADLTGAAMERSTLVRANLSRTSLGGTVLADADLHGARFAHAHLYHTNLCDVDVSRLCDEPRLQHGGPSSIDHRTVVKSYHHPRFRSFMADCGVPDVFAEYMIDCAKASDHNLLRRLMQSTFISYGGPDEAFAEKLYDALKARGVVTFFFPRTARVGERIDDEVFRRIQEHDRVLLVCSRKSLDRVGVVNEIQETLDREARDGGATYLLPITLDDYVFKGWKAKQPTLAERVGRRVVGDFRGTTRSRAKFESALNRVLDALKRKHP